MISSMAKNSSSGRLHLECIDIEAETHDVKTFYFHIISDTNGDDTPIGQYRPGQFVTLRLRHGDQLVPRSYTISSSPSRLMLLTLTIKRDPNGLVSRFMHDRFHVGEIISANGPNGTFDLHSIELQKHIVMLSGGSGITPLMSMLRYIYDTRGLNHNVTFLHSARTPSDIIFRQELELIASRLQIKLGFICKNDAEEGMDANFLDRAVLDKYVPKILDCTVLTCGPKPYMQAVKEILNELNFDMDHYHEESFGNPGLDRNPEGALPETLTLDKLEVLKRTEFIEDAQVSKLMAEKGPNEIEFTVSGKSVAYLPGQTILDIAVQVGIAIPTNCQMGLCGTCKIQCLSGNVQMDDTEGLEPGEKDTGMILTCCGRPNGRVSVEF